MHTATGLSRLFIERPIATTLLTLGLAWAGILGYAKLPVSPLPQVDFPTISVQAAMPGASPDTMATTVASPLERHLGQIADVTEMTSSSSVGQTRITCNSASTAISTVPHAMSKPPSTPPAPICPRHSAPIPPTARSIRPMRR